MNTKPRTRHSHHAGKPNARRGTPVAKHPVFFDYLAKPLLHEGRVTYIIGSDAPRFCRALTLHLSANQPFAGVKPPRALRIAVASVRGDVQEDFLRLIEATDILPSHRMAFHRLEFEGDELREPTELARVIRVNSSDVLLAECGQHVLAEFRKLLGDLSLPILTTASAPADDPEAIQIKVRDGNNFEITEANNEKS